MDEVKRYKCVVSYDGSNYDGWQSQNNCIQKVIEQAISTINNEPTKIIGCSRTDSKVHAYGQVFVFDSDKHISDYKKAINSQLPSDIYVKTVEEVSLNFHPRYDAKGKHYDYLINNGQYNPLLNNYAIYVEKELNVEKMKQASHVFLGKHDFTSMNATKISEVENQIRTIERIDIIKENDMIKISYYGDGFLRYMVRMISQCLIEVGLQHLTIEELTKILEAKDKQACHYNGQPQGLYLVEIYY